MDLSGPGIDVKLKERKKDNNNTRYSFNQKPSITEATLEIT
jgi:hypothetical protein